MGPRGNKTRFTQIGLQPWDRQGGRPAPASGSVMNTEAERARIILHEWVQSESLRRHCYAVADSMRHFAQLREVDADRWEAVGLLHDMDYERHPNTEQSPTDGHPFVAAAWLRDQGWSEEVCRAILSHADYSGVGRETPLERTLYAVDELSGFAMAVARVRPSKSIHEVDVAAVKKKMKDKAFARAVNREDIVRGAAELEMPLDEVISGVVAALKGRRRAVRVLDCRGSSAARAIVFHLHV